MTNPLHPPTAALSGPSAIRRLTTRDSIRSSVRHFLQTKTFKLQALAGALVICGGLIVAAYASVDSANIHLKLAAANEGPARLTMALAANAAMPSVVKISASKIVKTPTAFNGQSDDGSDLFGQFFGERNGGGRFQRPQAPRPTVKAGWVPA